MNDRELLNHLKKIYDNMQQIRKITDTLPDFENQDENNNRCDQLHTLTQNLEKDIETLINQTETEQNELKQNKII